MMRLKKGIIQFLKKVLPVSGIILFLSSCSGETFSDQLAAYASSNSDFIGCWFCPLFSTLFDTLNTIASNIALNLSDWFLVLLGFGILFFLVFKIGKMVIQLQEVSLMQFLEEIFHPLGRAMIAAVLLTFSLSIFQEILSPILQLSLTLSDQIYVEAGVSEMGLVKIARDKSNGKANLSLTCQQPEIPSNASSLAFTPSVKAALICNLQQVSNSLLLGITSGAFILKYGLTAAWMKLPDAGICVKSLIVIGSFLMILLYYPAKLLDGFIRLGFVTALMPLWIILWVFPATAGYTKKAWDMFIGTCILFIALSIIAAMILTLLTKIAFPDAFWTAVFNNQTDQAFKMLPSGGGFLLLLLVMGVFSIKLLQSAVILANTFSENISLNMDKTGSKVITQGLKLAGEAAKTTARIGFKAATKGASMLTSKAAAKINYYAQVGKHAAFAKTDEGKNKDLQHTAPSSPETVPNQSELNPNAQQNIAKGAGRITSGMEQVAQGTTQVARGTTQVAQGTAQAAKGGTQMGTGLASSAVSGVVAAVSLGRATGAAKQAAKGLQQAAKGATELAKGASKITQGITQTAKGSAQIARGSAQVAKGVQQVGSNALHIPKDLAQETEPLFDDDSEQQNADEKDE